MKSPFFRPAVFALFLAAALPLRAQSVTYALPETNRFEFFLAGKRPVKFDTLAGDFYIVNLPDSSWNAVVIPTRDAANSEENLRNVTFLLRHLTRENIGRINDKSRLGIRYCLLCLYMNADGSPAPLPPNPTPEVLANYQSRLLRYDSVTGEFALMDLLGGQFVRVAMPTKAAPKDVNLDNVKLIGNLKL